MGLSTLLIPQPRENHKFFGRIFGQRNGCWSYMKTRKISRKVATAVEKQGTHSGRCGSSSSQTQRSPSLMSLQRQQLLSLHKEDYRIYPQSVDLDAFFSKENKCEKVSDVCLLNDHFILVKMPNKELKPGVRHQMSNPNPKPKPGPKPSADLQRKLGSKLPRCFKCNRGSRVSPILEELEDAPSQPTEPLGLSLWTSNDDDDVEVFDSRTRIIPAQKQQQQQQFQANKYMQESVIVVQPQPQREPPDITSLQLQLETPTLALDTYTPPIRRGPLHWFLWPFRRRFASKSKAKLATVHKTYFVRWNKPPNTLWHGYGVERAKVLDKVELRRCRSAIF